MKRRDTGANTNDERKTMDMKKQNKKRARDFLKTKAKVPRNSQPGKSKSARDSPESLAIFGSSFQSQPSND
jgi:hypothetical protein